MEPYLTGDPSIDEVREARHRISARFDHDPKRLVAYYIELQKQFADRLVPPPAPPSPPEQSPTPDAA